MAKNIKKIAVVCTGNVCRSPMGERLLTHALAAEDEPLKSIKVCSLGVSAFPGDPASVNSVKALKKVGLDLTDHRSRRLTIQSYNEIDLFLVMTQSHKQIIESLFPENPKPVHLFREFGNYANNQVPDPYGATLDLYEETRDNLAEAIPSILQFLKSKTS